MLLDADKLMRKFERMPLPLLSALEALKRYQCGSLSKKIALSMANYRDSKHETESLEITERLRVEMMLATDRDLARGPRNT